jgi:hypothetical protein
MAKMAEALPQRQPWITGKPWWVKALVYGAFTGWFAGIAFVFGWILIKLYG